MRVHTESVQFKADQKLIDFIERKLSKMDHIFDRIIEAKVVLKLENSGQVKDKLAEVRINVPGDVLIAKAKHKTFEASIDHAVSSLRRQLGRYKDRGTRRVEAMIEEPSPQDQAPDHFLHPTDPD